MLRLEGKKMCGWCLTHPYAAVLPPSFTLFCSGLRGLVHGGLVHAPDAAVQPHVHKARGLGLLQGVVLLRQALRVALRLELVAPGAAARKTTQTPSVFDETLFTNFKSLHTMY